MREVLVPTCKKSKLKEIIERRNKGEPFKTIAYQMNQSPQTISRYFRVYEMYGTEAFADD